MKAPTTIIDPFHRKHEKLLIGWCEWCSLLKLNIPAIKAKIDTGATTSALHAFDIKPFYRSHVKYVHFSVPPLQHDMHVVVKCTAKVIDERNIMSSNGHKERRYVISSPITVGEKTWDIELTLSNRDPLKFRMLLGREALSKQALIDTNHAMVQGKFSKEFLKKIYRIKRFSS